MYVQTETASPNHQRYQQNRKIPCSTAPFSTFYFLLSQTYSLRPTCPAKPWRSRKACIMQNEPNFKNTQKGVSPSIARNYDSFHPLTKPKNEPKRTQSKPILAQKTGYQTQNEPKTNPISNCTWGTAKIVLILFDYWFFMQITVNFTQNYDMKGKIT